MTIEEAVRILMIRIDKIEALNELIMRQLFNKIKIKEIIRIDNANQREVLQIVDMHESPEGVRIMVR